MEDRIKERFNPAILEEALRRYGVSPDRARRLDGFESFMYEFDRAADEYVLRIGHSLRRSKMLIEAEVDWINYLAAGGASVARAILSTQGRLVEAIDDGHDGQFLATVFVKAQGQSPWKVGVNNIDDAWCARFMDGRKARIERDVPYVEFDFESLAREL